MSRFARGLLVALFVALSLACAGPAQRAQPSAATFDGLDHPPAEDATVEIPFGLVHQRGDVAYVSLEEGLTAVDVATGHIRWRRRDGGAPAAVVDEGVFVIGWAKGASSIQVRLLGAERGNVEFASSPVETLRGSIRVAFARVVGGTFHADVEINLDVDLPPACNGDREVCGVPEDPSLHLEVDLRTGKMVSRETSWLQRTAGELALGDGTLPAYRLDTTGRVSGTSWTVDGERVRVGLRPGPEPAYVLVRAGVDGEQVLMSGAHLAPHVQMAQSGGAAMIAVGRAGRVLRLVGCAAPLPEAGDPPERCQPVVQVYSLPDGTPLGELDIDALAGRDRAMVSAAGDYLFYVRTSGGVATPGSRWELVTIERSSGQEAWSAVVFTIRPAREEPPRQ
jgi:hypothetical protein